MSVEAVGTQAPHHLPTHRAVMFENRTALIRRWRLVRSGALSDPRLVSRWFPRQRELLELLDCLEEEEVLRAANVAQPLFGLSLRCMDFRLDACSAFEPTDPLERDSVQESFLALSTRLDAIRLNKQAASMFNLTGAEAAWLEGFCPLELHCLARDPAMVLTPLAALEYFMLSASDSFTFSSRTLLATLSRRQPTLA